MRLLICVGKTKALNPTARYILAAPSENLSSDICGQRRPRSACAYAQSDQGLRCPLTESLDTIESINGEQMPRRDFARDASESVHFAHARRHLFAWRRPFTVHIYVNKTFPHKETGFTC